MQMFAEIFIPISEQTEAPFIILKLHFVLVVIIGN